MALFSEDLFNVFEETEKPSPAKSKKRKREDQKADEDGATVSEDLKKVRVESRKDDEAGTLDGSTEETSEKTSLEENKGLEIKQTGDSEL
jgi:hypothetical protein